MTKWLLCLPALFYAITSLAAPKLTEADYRVQCQDLLTGKEAPSWAAEEATWMSKIRPISLKFYGNGSKLSLLQKSVLGIDQKLEVDPESLDLTFSSTSKAIRITSRQGDGAIGEQTFPWKSARYGYLDFSKYAVMEINEFGTEVKSEVRAGLIFLLTKKIGTVEIGLGFKSHYRQIRNGYNDPSSVKEIALQLFVVRECKRVLGGNGDFLFPVAGTDPQSKNLCLTPIGSLNTPSDPESEPQYSSWPVTG